MGQVITVSEAALPMVLYGDKSQVVGNYIMQQLGQMPQVFNEFSQRVYDSLLTSYNFINDKLTQYGIRNEIQNSGLQIVDNYYEDLMSFQRLQEANLTMQRWIMAHPQVRQMYVDQNLDGYSSTYKNISGKETGEEEYNYRMVMDGVVQPTEDGWVVKHFIQDLMVGDRELTHFEKSKILTTWECIDHVLSSGDWDFTCKSDQPVKFNKE